MPEQNPVEQKDAKTSGSGPDTPSPSARQVVSSVLAAAFGVQSKENRERDFQHGKPAVFIVTGILFTVVFILVVVGVVNAVLRTAG